MTTRERKIFSFREKPTAISDAMLTEVTAALTQHHMLVGPTSTAPSTATTIDHQHPPDHPETSHTPPPMSSLLRNQLSVPNHVAIKPRSHHMKKGKGVVSLPQLSLSTHYASFQPNEHGVLRDRGAVEAHVKHIVNEWVSAYSEELMSHEAITSGVQLVLAQIRTTTEFLGTPNALRGAVVFMLMDKVVATMGRYNPVMQTLLQEMRTMVYIRKTPGAHVTSSIVNAPTALGHYLEHSTYFEQYLNMQSQYEEFQRMANMVKRTLENKLVVMDRAVKKWQVMLVSRHFSCWRNTAKRSKFRQCAIKTFTQRANRKDLLQTTFYAWRLVCANLKVDVERTQLTENMDFILQKEATTSSRLAETEDKLEEARAQLLRLKEEVESLRDENAHLRVLSQSHEYRVVQWRNVTVAYVQYVLLLSETVTKPPPSATPNAAAVLSPEEIAVNTYTLVEQTLLTWLFNVLTEHGLQKALRRRVSNFTTDLKDGAAYILLLHCVTEGALSLQHLEHNDFHRRAEVLLEKVTSLGMDCGITPEDLVSGIPDYHILLMYTLWSQYFIPPEIVKFETSAMESINNATSQCSFIDDVREFDKKLTSVKSSHQAWLTARNIIGRYVHSLLLTRSRGNPTKIVTKQEQKEMQVDMKNFTTLAMEKLPEVFPLMPLANPEANSAREAENNAELMTTQAVLLRNYTHLRRVYKYYATLGVTKPRPLAMDVVQFHRLCLDTKIIGQGFMKKDCVALFQDTNDRNADRGLVMPDNSVLDEKFVAERVKNNTNNNNTATAPPDASYSTITGTNDEVIVNEVQYNPENMLIANEFVQLLCRVAARKFINEPLPNNATAPLKVSDALTTLLTKHIIPKAYIADSVEFKQEIFSELVQSVLKKLRRHTMKVFKHYCSGHDNSAGITAEEFTTMLKDAGALEAPLTQRHIMEIYAQFQECPDMASSALVYSEFEEALVCVAVFRNPAPYIPLHTKVNAFLEGQLLQELSKIVKK
eukprot:PhF_6_TR10074/c0_g1_i1/m.15637